MINVTLFNFFYINVIAYINKECFTFSPHLNQFVNCSCYN